MDQLKRFFSIPNYHQVAVVDTLLVAFFTMQPTLFLILTLKSKGLPVDITKSYVSGEFLLYSISFLSSSYLVFNQFRIKATDWKSNLNKVIILLLSIISGYYGLMSNTTQLDKEFLKYSSICAFIISFLIFYYAQILANKNSPDVAGERREEQQVIEDALS
jgi:hypothetical protein